MPMSEFNQLCNEAKREIQEVDIQQLKAMQQRKEDFDLIDVRGGNRSALAAWMLKKMGFKNVYSLIGGWSAWKSQ